MTTVSSVSRLSGKSITPINDVRICNVTAAISRHSINLCLLLHWRFYSPSKFTQLILYNVTGGEG